MVPGTLGRLWPVSGAGGSPGKLANPQSPIHLPGATAVSALGKRKAWEEEGGKRRPESPGDCRYNQVLICLLRTKNLPAKQETWVQSLSREDPLEEGMETHSRILACKIPWTEEPGRVQSMESQSDTTEQLTLSLKHDTLRCCSFFRLIPWYKVWNYIKTPRQRELFSWSLLGLS